MWGKNLDILSICLILSIFCREVESSSLCPLFVSKPPTHDAYSPINIITKNAIPAKVFTPVNLRDGLFGPLFIKNTGYALEIFGNPEVVSGGTVFGGVLCDQVFKFNKLRIWISQNPDGRSYNQINGKGSPLTISLHYYNEKYGSFEEGIKHRGGAAMIHYMITYGPIINPFFILPDIAIRLFHFPGTSLYFAPEIILYAWFNIIFLIDEYYAFHGSYLDLETGKEYPNVIQIQTAGIYPLLTKEQLGAFQSLLNINGTKMETVAPLKSRNQPIYSGRGYTETYSLY